MQGGPARNVRMTRRRSQSNEFGRDEALSRPGGMDLRHVKNKLHTLQTWVETRKTQVVTILIRLEETLHGFGGDSATPMDWLEKELNAVVGDLKELEQTEMETWLLATRVYGPSAQASRSEAWTHWHCQVCTKAMILRQRVWMAAMPPCHRSGGFLERVKLPTFSGNQEDYGEFKIQFQEMCRGESYSEVIEMAQLRQKLPREAVAILVGLTTTAAAWARLDERYKNREMSVIAELKRLKGFKSSKAASYDRIMELATAVQHCSTVLTALGREKELLRDRETVAEIINTMPADSQQRWYHCRGGTTADPLPMRTRRGR